jgi:ankyrin repeat protein
MGRILSSADGYRATPLVAAATFGHENLIHMLLDHGADPLPYDTLGRSAISCAAEHRFSWNTVQRLFQAVLDVGGDITAGPISGDELAPLHCFARQGCLPAVELLLKHDADILVRTQAGVTALDLALFNYSREPRVYEEVCQLLIETINTADRDYDHTLPSIEPLRGGTSLHLAAQHGSESLVRLLISSGVNSQVLDDEGNSASDLARLSGHEAVVQVLSDKLNLSHKTENPVT